MTRLLSYYDDQVEMEVLQGEGTFSRRKSGRYNVTDTTNVKPEFKWPNEGYITNSSVKKPAYDDMNMAQWVAVNFHSNDSVQLFDNNGFNFGTSKFSLLAEQAGICVWQCSKNIESNNVLAFGSCVRPAVEGDTNSWKESNCRDCDHESWLDMYDIHCGIGNSTFLLCDSAGVLLGTCTRSFPNLGVDQLVNTEGIQATLSVYEVREIFDFGYGYIVQIRGSKDQHVDGVYHTCWNDDLEAYVFQRKLLGWSGFMLLVDAFPIEVRRTHLLDKKLTLSFIMTIILKICSVWSIMVVHV